MNWALIVMMCSRFCYPQYVELYPNKAACVQQIPATSNWAQTTHYCVPVVTK